MTTPILGIDVSKDKLDCFFLLEGGKHSAGFSNDPAGLAELDRKLKELKLTQLHAGLEATGRYGRAVALHLYNQGKTVSVINPRCVKHYAAAKLCRNKCDAADAALIAQFVKETSPAPWSPPSQALAELKELTRLSQAYKEALVREKNRLSSALECRVAALEVKRAICRLEKSLDRLAKAIHDLLQKDPVLREQAQLLCSIPAIGEATAAVVLAELPPVTDFESASQAAAFAGVTPRQKTSGSSLRGKTRMSKTGNRHLRRCLYMPALTALKCNPIIQADALRLSAAGKGKMCIVGAAMHRLLRMMFGVLKHRKPFDPLRGQAAPVAA